MTGSTFFWMSVPGEVQWGPALRVWRTHDVPHGESAKPGQCLTGVMDPHPLGLKVRATRAASVRLQLLCQPFCNRLILCQTAIPIASHSPAMPPRLTPLVPLFFKDRTLHRSRFHGQKLLFFFLV